MYLHSMYFVLIRNPLYKYFRVNVCVSVSIYIYIDMCIYVVIMCTWAFIGDKVQKVYGQNRNRAHDAASLLTINE